MTIFSIPLVRRTVSYTKIPGSRKKEKKYGASIFRITLRRLAGPEEFPTAYIVHKIVDGKPLDKVIRSYNGKLFSDTGIKESEGKKLQTCIETILPEDVIPEEVSKSIHEQEEKLVIYDGTLWRLDYEPAYQKVSHMSINEDTDEAYCMLCELTENSVISPDIFRADELPIIKERIKSSASSDACKERWLRRLDIEYIEVGEVFISKLDSRENRLFDQLSKNVISLVHTYLEQDTYPMSQPLADKMISLIVSKLWNSDYYNKETVCLTRSDFFKAFHDVLGETLGVQNKEANKI